jgi:hypothetical protein
MEATQQRETIRYVLDAAQPAVASKRGESAVLHSTSAALLLREEEQAQTQLSGYGKWCLAAQGVFWRDAEGNKFVAGDVNTPKFRTPSRE